LKARKTTLTRLRYFRWNCSITTHNRRSIVVPAMASTREQLRSEISFRDEVIRVSCLEGANGKVERIVSFHGRYGLCPRRFGIVPDCECSNPWHQRVAEKPRDAQQTRMSRSARSGLLARGQVTSADAALHHNFKSGARLSADMLTSAHRIRRRY